MKKYVFTISMAIVLPFCASFAEAQNQQPAPSKEQREQMAKAHEDMALCLRSESSPQDCRQQMQKQCQNQGNDLGCPMMEGMGRGMMRNLKSKDSTKGK